MTTIEHSQEQVNGKYLDLFGGQGQNRTGAPSPAAALGRHIDLYGLAEHGLAKCCPNEKGSSGLSYSANGAVFSNGAIFCT